MCFLIECLVLTLFHIILLLSVSPVVDSNAGYQKIALFSSLYFTHFCKTHTSVNAVTDHLIPTLNGRNISSI